MTSLIQIKTADPARFGAEPRYLAGEAAGTGQTAMLLGLAQVETDLTIGDPAAIAYLGVPIAISKDATKTQETCNSYNPMIDS